jgi:hypothetical protein
MMVKELYLQSGWWVRVQPFPPMAVQGIMNKPEFWEPPPPKVEIKTKGGSEWVDAPFNSPEWDEYVKARREVEIARQTEWQQAGYEYGIVEWSEDQKKWTDKVPAGWKLSPVIEKQLGKVDRVKAWKLYGLMITNTDFDAVRRAVFPSTMEPLMEGELQASEDSFPDNV